MKKTSANQDVPASLEGLKDLTRDEFIQHWEQAHGQKPPKGITSRLLLFSAGYQLQAKAYGGLTTAQRRKLEVNRSKRRQSNKPLNSKKGSVSKRAGSTPLAIGSRLIREWHGIQHVVQATDCGYRYNGVDYRSLSQVARQITGARWSGPRFFGV